VLYDSGVFAIADTARVLFVVVDYFGGRFRISRGADGNQSATDFERGSAGRVSCGEPIADVPSADLYIGPVAGTPALRA
jgi:hypothetical protein